MSWKTFEARYVGLEGTLTLSLATPGEVIGPTGVPEPGIPLTITHGDASFDEIFDETVWLDAGFRVLRRDLDCVAITATCEVGSRDFTWRGMPNQWGIFDAPQRTVFEARPNNALQIPWVEEELGYRLDFGNVVWEQFHEDRWFEWNGQVWPARIVTEHGEEFQLRNASVGDSFEFTHETNGISPLPGQRAGVLSADSRDLIPGAQESIEQVIAHALTDPDFAAALDEGCLVRLTSMPRAGSSAFDTPIVGQVNMTRVDRFDIHIAKQAGVVAWAVEKRWQRTSGDDPQWSVQKIDPGVTTPKNCDRVSQSQGNGADIKNWWKFFNRTIGPGEPILFTYNEDQEPPWLQSLGSGTLAFARIHWNDEGFGFAESLNVAEHGYGIRQITANNTVLSQFDQGTFSREIPQS